MTHNRKPQRAWRTVRRWIINLVFVYLGIILVLMFMENWFIYHPHSPEDGWSKPKDANVQDIWLQAADGNRIHAWWFPRPNAKWVVLYCHGNAGNLSYRQDPIQKCWQDQMKASVLIFDYPGFGRSGGKPSEAGCYASATAAYDWLRKQSSIPANSIILYGNSLGGAVAVDLALSRPHRALVLLSTFTSVPDIAQEVFPFLPCRWMVRTQFDNRRKLNQYAGRLFIGHGTADPVIPYHHGERLFEAAKAAKQKCFLSLPQYGHDEYPGKEFYDNLSQFLAEGESS